MIFLKIINIKICWMIVVFKYRNNDVLDRFGLTYKIFDLNYKIVIPLKKNKVNY